MTDASTPSPSVPERPQYGEYATPDEQRARIRQPDASRVLETGRVPAAPAPTSVPSAAPVAPGRAPTAKGSTADRVVTIVLLALGFVHVAITATTLFLFDRVIVFMLEFYGYDPARLTDTTDLRLAGAFAATALIALWLLAVAVSWARLRRGRIAFWIPVVLAIVAMIVVNLFLSPVLEGEPVIEDMLTTGLSPTEPAD